MGTWDGMEMLQGHTSVEGEHPLVQLQSWGQSPGEGMRIGLRGCIEHPCAPALRRSPCGPHSCPYPSWVTCAPPGCTWGHMTGPMGAGGKAQGMESVCSGNPCGHVSARLFPITLSVEGLSGTNVPGPGAHMADPPPPHLTTGGGRKTARSPKTYTL